MLTKYFYIKNFLIKTLVFILCSPFIYLWFVLAWPFGYFIAMDYNINKLINYFKFNRFLCFYLFLFIILWFFFSLFIGFFFLCFSFIKYLTDDQSLKISLILLLGLIWIIDFFKIFLKNNY